MKLKYYLRGLGVGIILSTIILSFAIKKDTKNDLTDQEIIARAKELGMEMKSENSYDFDAVDESIQDSMAPEKETTTTDGNTNQPTESADSNKENDGDKNETSKETDSENQEDESNVSSNKEPGTTESKDQENHSNDKVDPVRKTITIEEGMSAKQVCKMLEDQGIISDSEDFNKYLKEKKYTEKIRAQETEIPVNADYQTIARILIRAYN